MKTRLKKLIFPIYFLAIIIFLVGVFEYALQNLYHFGDPVIYSSSPTYGYRCCFMVPQS